MYIHILAVATIYRFTFIFEPGLVLHLHKVQIKIMIAIFHVITTKYNNYLLYNIAFIFLH